MNRAIGLGFAKLNGEPRSLAATVEAAVDIANESPRDELLTVDSPPMDIIVAVAKRNVSAISTLGLAFQARDDIGRVLREQSLEATRLFGPIPDDGHALDVYIDEVMAEVIEAAASANVEVGSEWDDQYLVDLANGDGISR